MRRNEVEPTPATPAAPLSAKERLAQKAKKAAPTGPKKKLREVIEIGTTLEEQVYAAAIDRLAAASHAQKAIEGHFEASKAIVLPYVRKIVLRDWCEQQRKLENPRVRTPKGSSFILQCKNTLSGARGFRVPKDENGNAIPIVSHLESNGVGEELSARLLDEGEFQEETVLSLNMAKLEKNNAPLAARLMDLIDAASNGGVTTADGRKISFNDSELETMLETNNDVTVKEGFLERSISHCLAVAGNDVDEASDLLSKLLEAVPPQWAFSSVNCVNPDEEIVKLLHEDPTPTSPPKAPQACQSGDGKYTIRVEGKLVTVIRNRDGKQVGTKTCRDERHATNTVRQFQNDQTKIDAFIAEQA